MDKKFLLQCDRLLKVLPSRIIMEPSEVATYLNVSETVAATVIDRLRQDSLADGYGSGPVSRNHRTSVFHDFYLEEIRKIKDYNRTKRYAFWGFLLSVISILWPLAKYLLEVLKG